MSTNPAVVIPLAPASSAANELKSLMVDAIKREHNSRFNASDFIDEKVIDACIKKSCWNPSLQCLFIIDEQRDELSRVKADQIFSALTQSFGDIIRTDDLDAHISMCEASGVVMKGVYRAVKSVVSKEIVSYLIWNNQRDLMSMTVNMFTNESRIDFFDNEAVVLLKHRPYVYRVDPRDMSELPLLQSELDWEVINDYMEHFPALNDFIHMIVASRFAIDRKKSFLWMRAESDWGKGFLGSTLSKMGIVNETSVDEIELMASGKPVGCMPERFLRSLILWVDEFKKVKSELKQLCSSVTLSPKFRPSTPVDLYLKLFTSAESVASLANDEYGVEDQFANRYSYMSPNDLSGQLDKRPVFKNKGKYYYSKHVGNYICLMLNEEIDKMIKLGSHQASIKADQFIDKFYEKYRIDREFSRLSDSMAGIAYEVAAELHKQANEPFSAQKQHIVWDKGTVYIKSTSTVVKQVLATMFDHSMLATVSKRTEELIKELSADGTGVKPRRVGGGLVKCIELKKLKDFPKSAIPDGLSKEEIPM